MLSASYLDSLSDEMEALYSQLHQDVLIDIARRVKKTGVLTGSAEWQFRMLEEQGLLRNEIIEKVAKYSNISKAKVSKLFKDGLLQSYSGKDYKALGVSAEEMLKKSYSYNALLLGLNKTNSTLSNLTGIIENSTAGVFEEVCSRAYMKVTSGAFSYEEASSFAADELLKLDKEKIVYAESGRRISVEAGVRRAIVTGLNQTVCQSMFGAAKDLGTNLVETTAHYGARPEHSFWQGRIFQLEGSGKYPNFYSATDYGSATGLGGVNCRHNFHPFFEEISEQQYSKETVNKWNDDTVDYNGEKITYYDATQKMRNYERNIRSLKKQKGVVENLGGDSLRLNQRKMAFEKKARELNKQTGVPLDYKRRRIARY